MQNVPTKHSDQIAHRYLLSQAINWLLGLFNSLPDATAGQVYTADGNGGASFETMTDYALEVSLGNIAGVSSVNKFGHATDCDSGVLTDIWDGADGTTSTDIWVPPTAARGHQISSTSANDTSAGTGARTIQVYGLTDWDTAETSEVITMAGLTNVPTVNNYVIIYRVKVLTWGTGGVNAGNITTVADTDLTVTAAILAGENQSQMCIFGIPSTQKFRMEHAQVEIVKSAGSATIIEGNILFMPDPATNAANNTAWINKEHFSHTNGSNPWEHDYDVPKKFDGPGIIKFQVTSSNNNQQATGGFEGYLVDNV